jgi:glyoxylase-like metal-dependent hydrolase (beta-lactamase superfamily II)
MEESGAGWHLPLAQWLRATLESEAKLLDPAGNSAAAARWQRRRAQVEEYIPAMQGVLPVLPDLSFEGELVLNDRRQPLHLRSLGRAHSEGDIVILSPSRKVIATGDCAYDALPFAGVCFRDLESVEFDRLAGGHGPAADRQCVKERRSYLEELIGLAARAKSEGQTLDQFAEAVSPEKIVSLRNGVGAKYSSEPRSLLAVPPPGVDSVRSFAVAVKENAAHIWQRLGAQ